MAVIAVSPREPDGWLIKRSTLATIIELAQQYTDDPSDRQELEESLAASGLFFYVMPPAQARRLAMAVAKAVRDLQMRWEQSELEGEREFVPTLREIEKRLISLAQDTAAASTDVPGPECTDRGGGSAD